MAKLRPAVSAALDPLDLTLPSFVCLRSLSLAPNRSNADLARDASISPQSMNYVLKRLQELGALSRPDSVPSGRSRPATLTARGRALLANAEAAVRSAEDAVLVELSTAEREQLRGLLTIVA